ncbi:MAG: hypothetical protein ACRDSR_08005 [Pseudonocardiaceae bacterium]
MNARDTLTVHQLLGRIVYFHTLFIEPALAATNRPTGCGEACCRHRPSAPAPVDTTPALRDTAWAAVGEIATTLAAATCPGQASWCCPTCQILAAGKTIAQCWMDVEHRAYGAPLTQPDAWKECSRTIAVRLAAAFSHQHDSVCAVLTRATATPKTVQPSLPARLPLTSELLALWADPTDHAPVTSWLNHCTGLTDIAQALDIRKTTR